MKSPPLTGDGLPQILSSFGETVAPVRMMASMCAICHEITERVKRYHWLLTNNEDQQLRLTITQMIEELEYKRDTVHSMENDAKRKRILHHLMAALAYAEELRDLTSQSAIGQVKNQIEARFKPLNARDG